MKPLRNNQNNTIFWDIMPYTSAEVHNQLCAVYLVDLIFVLTDGGGKIFRSIFWTTGLLLDYSVISEDSTL
jgi:hypothetical protein